MRRRNPALVLLFSMLTFGVYTLFWFYAINRELAAITLRPWPVRRRVRDFAILVAASLLAALPFLATGDEAFLAASAVIGVGAAMVLVVIEFRTCETIERAQRKHRRRRTGAVPLFLLLLLLPVVGIPWVQIQINLLRT